MTMPLRDRDKLMVGIEDVARSIGRVLSKQQAWQCGNRARDEWVARVGALPAKMMTPKRDGVGSHMKAAYPLAWAPRLAQIIMEVDPDVAPQMDFFVDIMPLGFPF